MVRTHPTTERAGTSGCMVAMVSHDLKIQVLYFLRQHAKLIPIKWRLRCRSGSRWAYGRLCIVTHLRG